MNELKDQILKNYYVSLQSATFTLDKDGNSTMTDKGMQKIVQIPIDYLMQLIETYTTKKCEDYKKEMFDTAYNTFKIMGKSVDEICVILSALELERITDIKVTMGNLDKLSKIVTEDLRESYQKAITESFTQLSTQLKTNKEMK